ncbi:MAG: GntR family transcriptional regulator [Pseudomonadota bacterium]|nr:GntR family transcriptional regulator [Pseudomonadota bacterium]
MKSSNSQTLNVALPEPQSDSDALSDLVYRAVLDALFRGELQGGDPISELRIAKTLGVSRTPVHAAVRDLIRDGLLMQEDGRRPCVARITRDDLFEIFEMRRLLEGEAAFRAAERMDRVTMMRLEKALETLDDREPNDELLLDWSRVDDDFHEAIAISCDQKRLSSDILRYRRIHYALNSIRMQAELVPQAVAEHRAILAALADRDGERARAEMQQHLREWQAYYVNLVSTAQSSSFRS